MAAIHLTQKEFNEIHKGRNISKETGYQTEDNAGMKNKLSDLNNHLFEQLERLNDGDLTEEELEKEIKRAKSIAEISQQIIDNGSLTLKTAQFLTDQGYGMNGNMEKSIMGYVGNVPSEEQKKING